MDLVFLSHFEISDFRNIEHIEIVPDNRFNIISGMNGAGKTNLLEAIYYFSALRSFRTPRRGELVRHGASTARLKGLFSGAAAGLLCEFEIGRETRRIRTGGKDMVSTAAHFSEIPMVLFSPSNISLIQGGSEERRRFMDRALFQAESAYPAIITSYTRALKSRNRLLKIKGVSRGLLSPFDEQIAELGAKIVEKRSLFIERSSPKFKEAFSYISRGLVGRIEYHPDIQGGKEAILSSLDSSLYTDERRGFTSRGPHADDLEIYINDLAAKKFASQGQQRMAVLSMKMAETVVLHQVKGRVPVLLLDDISSELDRDSNRSLFDFLRHVGGQVFITTTHLDHVLLEEGRRDFVVENGVIEHRGSLR